MPVLLVVLIIMLFIFLSLIIFLFNGKKFKNMIMNILETIGDIFKDEDS